MSHAGASSHRELANQLHERALNSGITSDELRRGGLRGDLGEPSRAGPYGSHVRQIEVDSSRVTDAQVLAAREFAGSDKATFEVILAAAIGAGLRRWDVAERVIAEAENAPG